MTNTDGHKNNDNSGQPDKPASVPAVVTPAQRRRLIAVDREFLPAALEILETPPSPVRVAILWFICIVTALSLIWAYFGKFDIYAVAQGRIQPTGRSKVVQPFEPGKVFAVFVENGSRVNMDDVLVELDPTESSADAEALTRDFESAAAEAIRRRTAVAAANAEEITPPTIAFPPEISKAIQTREQANLTAELAQLVAMRQSVKSQRDERQATRRRLMDSTAVRKKLIELTTERVEMRQEVKDRGAGSRALVIDALQQLEAERTTLTAEQGQLAETEFALETLKHKLVELTAQFVADQTQEGRGGRTQGRPAGAGSHQGQVEGRAHAAARADRWHGAAVEHHDPGTGGLRRPAADDDRAARWHHRN